MKVVYEFDRSDSLRLEVFSRAEVFYDALQQIQGYLTFEQREGEEIDAKDVLDKIEDIIEGTGINDF